MTDQDNPQLVSLPKAMTPRIREMEKAIKRFCATGARYDVRAEHIVFFCTMAGWQTALQEVADADGNGSAEGIVLAMSNFVSASISMFPDEVYHEAVGWVLTSMLARDRQRMARALAKFVQDMDVPEGPPQ